MACCLSCWFFFSSRRRHTRLQGDWSSDVCSSDLSPPKEIPKEEPKAIPIPARDAKRKGPRESEQKKPPPKEIAKVEENRIPFGQGGPVSGPYGSFSAGGAEGGLTFSGGRGGFGSRFGC